jgi:hypothetical protein
LTAEEHRKKILNVVNQLSDQELERVSEMLAQQENEENVGAKQDGEVAQVENAEPTKADDDAQSLMSKVKSLS